MSKQILRMELNTEAFLYFTFKISTDWGATHVLSGEQHGPNYLCCWLPTFSSRPELKILSSRLSRTAVSGRETAVSLAVLQTVLAAAGNEWWADEGTGADWRRWVGHRMGDHMTPDYLSRHHGWLWLYSATASTFFTLFSQFMSKIKNNEYYDSVKMTGLGRMFLISISDENDE